MRGKGYSTGERAGVIDAKHIKAMGSSRALFTWAIRRQTGATADGWGIVLFGKAITCGQIQQELGKDEGKLLNEKTIRRWIRRLVLKRYLRIKRARYGTVIYIANQKKFTSASGKISTSRLDKVARSGIDTENVRSETYSNEITRDIEEMSDLAKIGQPCPISNVRSEPEDVENRTDDDILIEPKTYTTTTTTRKKEQRSLTVEITEPQKPPEKTEAKTSQPPHTPFEGFRAAFRALVDSKSNPEWQPIGVREQELRRQKIKREFEDSELSRREPEMALTG